MAEILIKNMEMPKSCLGELNGKNDCPIVGICGIFKATPFKEKENIVWEQRLKDCPLVELPPHGRLGDLDEISDKLLGKGLTRFFVREKRYLTIGDARKIIENAPVIVEASNGTDH